MQISIDLELNDVELEATGTFIADYGYGADADGNRGIHRVFLDAIDYKIYNRRCYELSEEEVQVVESALWDAYENTERR